MAELSPGVEEKSHHGDCAWCGGPFPVYKAHGVSIRGKLVWCSVECALDCAAAVCARLGGASLLRHSRECATRETS